MFIQVLRAKVHRATVTEHNLEYEGSLTLDADLIELAGLHVHEKISVWNVTNGNRFETYVIEGAPGSGTVCVNGAAAHLAKKGDVVIVAAYGFIDPEATDGRIPPPVVVRVDARRPLSDWSPETKP